MIAHQTVKMARILSSMHIEIVEMGEAYRQYLSQTQTPVQALGSGLIDQSQKMTVAARATAEKKAFGHRS
jgi:hypothetical protein